MRRESRNRLRLFVTASLLFAGLATLPIQAQTETIIYSFTGMADGNYPVGGLIIDGSGNLYGVTQDGGASSAGTVYELSPGSGAHWTKTVLHSFQSGTTDVTSPYSNLVFDSKGNLFGVSASSGAHGNGGIFELSPGSNGTWSEQVIYSFTGGSDTLSYGSALAIDGAGDLYGYLAQVNSSAGLSYGGIFELEAGSNGTWTEKVLHRFSGGDGAAPNSGQLAVDSAGNLYGEAYDSRHDFGLVFKLARGSNGSWTEKILHTFTGAADGSAAYASRLLIDANGNVFGASTWNIFELMPGSNGTWTEKILRTFSGGADGAYPESGLTFGASGAIYGTTNAGGAHHGTVFELTPHANGNWSDRLLHRFTATGGDCLDPFFATLVVDKQGNLFGTTSNGGASNLGAVFEVTP